MTVAKELEYRRLDGTDVALNQQANINFYGKGNENHDLGAGHLCLVEYQQFRGFSLLMIACRT
jgi:hypothetical protein